MSLESPFSLAGRTVLVTGASSGIGRAAAVLCAGQGARLVLTGRDEARLQETLAALSAGDHLVVPARLDDAAERAQLVAALPRLDGVVFCAGTLRSVPVRFAAEEDISELIQINYTATALLTTALLGQKRIARGASLVYVSSVAAHHSAEPGNALYAASKAAVAAFARNLATEVVARGIRVNCVVPGMVRTPLLARFAAGEEELAANERKYPLGFSNPEDVAAAIAFLLSPGAARITGTELLIDGGLTLS